jgi:hypothetical protein
MMEFCCDTCHTRKKAAQRWILGLAAESASARTERREISVLPAWTDARAIHPLAVHFCSERCREKYVTWLFQYQLAS